MLARSGAWFPVRWRIAPILTVTMVILTVTFITTTTLLDISRAREIYWDELRNRGRTLADQMNDQLADPLYLQNIEDIQKIATLISSQTDVEYVRVFTPEGAMLVDTTVDGFRSLGTQITALGLRSLDEQRTIEEINSGLMEIARPVTIGAQLIGGLQIGLRSDVLEEHIDAIIAEHIRQGIILTTLAAGIAYLIARTFSRPVQSLVTATNDMAEGHLDTRVHEIHGGELRELAGSFNTMAAELQTTIGELQDSRRRIVGAQESVRREIATHLHGRVQARLLVLRMELHRMMRQAEQGAGSNEEMADLIEQLDDLIQNDITALSRRLYPSILRRGMIPALQSLADQFEPSFTITLDIGSRYSQLEGETRSAIPETVKLAAYRIAEDALTNVLKHAHATAATIRLDLLDGNYLRIAIEDNGVGFDLGEAGRGLGLEAIQDYASAVGGSSTVWSTPGMGTSVTAQLPLAVPEGNGE